MELFGPTLLRNFPSKKSDFLGIFKNILTRFYCIYKILVLHAVSMVHGRKIISIEIVVHTLYICEKMYI
jgi:hypothetical protein